MTYKEITLVHTLLQDSLKAVRRKNASLNIKL